MSRSSSLTPRLQFWLEHVRTCAQRRQSLSSYAAEHGLVLGSLYEAKSQLKRLGALAVRPLAPRFVRANAQIAPTPVAKPCLCCVLLPNGVPTATSDRQ